MGAPSLVFVGPFDSFVKWFIAEPCLVTRRLPGRRVSTQTGGRHESGLHSRASSTHGLLTVGAIIRYLAEKFPAEVVNLPPTLQVTDDAEGA